MTILDIDQRDRSRSVSRSTHARPGRLQTQARHVEIALVFVATVLRYTISILPQVRREIAHWHARAARIPDPTLRLLAFQALGKRGNIEGAALLATLAPSARQRDTLRALVSFQAAYNYLDVLSEQPSVHPTGAAHQLHQALLTALDPDVAHPDYYAHYPHQEDGGYLTEIVENCRRALALLPSYPNVMEPAGDAAARKVAFQSLNLTESQGGHYALKHWALKETPEGSGRTWSETAAAAGSALPVHALIAAAASPAQRRRGLASLKDAYFPHLSALHSLLDSLVDRGEDRLAGQRSFLDYYPSTASTAASLGSLAHQAKRDTEMLPDGDRHRVILTAMASYYLSAPQCSGPEAAAVSQAVSEMLGGPLRVAILIFRARRRALSLARRAYS
jgi:tetraprenyl-beta-curcumene synthase